MLAYCIGALWVMADDVVALLCSSVFFFLAVVGRTRLELRDKHNALRSSNLRT